MKNQSIRQAPGFSLIELMIAIAIVAILLALGLPGFNSLITRNRIASQTSDFATSLSLARSEAIKRGLPVVVRRTTTNWESGWQVFVDADNDETYTAGTDTLLRSYDLLTGGNTLRTSSGSSSTQFGQWIRFSSLGAVTAANGTAVAGDFRLCGASADVTTAYGIRIGSSGQISQCKLSDCPMANTSKVCP